jgi:hypothetical protein
MSPDLFIQLPLLTIGFSPRTALSVHLVFAECSDKEEEKKCGKLSECLF